MAGGRKTLLPLSSDRPGDAAGLCVAQPWRSDRSDNHERPSRLVVEPLNCRQYSKPKVQGLTSSDLRIFTCQFASSSTVGSSGCSSPRVKKSGAHGVLSLESVIPRPE